MAEHYAVRLEDRSIRSDSLTGTANAQSATHGRTVPASPRHGLHANSSISPDKLVKLTKDLVIADCDPGRTRTRSSTRPSDGLVRDCKRGFQRLYGGCHLSKVKVSLATSKESGVFGLGEPSSCAIADEIVLLGVESARSERVRSVVSG